MFSGAASLDSVYDRKGQKLTICEASNQVFSVLHAIVCRFIDNDSNVMGNPAPETFYSTITEGIRHIVPEVAKYVESFKSLDFLGSDIQDYFMRDRSVEDCRLMLAALILHEDTRYFTTLFICAVMNELMNRKVKTIPEAIQEIPKINLRVLIFNVDNFDIFISTYKKLSPPSQ